MSSGWLKQRKFTKDYTTVNKDLNMLETIYTIPVNEAFDECAADHSIGCPFCHLYKKLESNELDLILGASMMEPDIRMKTNEMGFCTEHYAKMFARNNRLQLGLMLESHLDVVREELDSGKLLNLIRGKGAVASDKLQKLENSCYVCDRIENNFQKMIENAVYLWNVDSDKKEKPFEDKIKAQSHFCLPHYRKFIECARICLEKKQFGDFYSIITDIEKAYFDSLRNDVSWFCKKFDYRYENEPWGNSKDSVERAIALLNGKH